MMSNKRNLLLAAGAGSAVAVTTVSAGGYAITRGLMDIALNRDEPRILEKLMNSITHSRRTAEFMDEVHRTEELLLEKETEAVTILAGDGTELIGHFLPAKEPERIIIAMHGWRARWSRDFGMIADFWHDSGCSVLFAEQRGQNGSSCKYMGFGLTERFDCHDWLCWAAAKYPDMPVYAAGISMGASTVLMTADMKLPENVRGIMADCAFTSPDAIWRHVVHDNLHLPYGLRGKVADVICRKRTGYGSDDCNTARVLSKAKVPVLFIHGTDDNFVPVDMAYENYKACTSEKRLHVVPGADHGMSCYIDSEGYRKAMREFWRDFDY